MQRTSNFADNGQDANGSPGEASQETASPQPETLPMHPPHHSHQQQQQHVPHHNGGPFGGRDFAALPRKAPPHMRGLNFKVSSPTDNLSPMSKKIIADRHNVIKGMQPRVLKDALLNSSGSFKPAVEDKENHPALTRPIMTGSLHDAKDTTGDAEDDCSDHQPSTPTHSSIMQQDISMQ